MRQMIDKVIKLTGNGDAAVLLGLFLTFVTFTGQPFICSSINLLNLPT